MKRKRIEELDENLKAATINATREWRWIDAAGTRISKRGLAWFEENRIGAGSAWSRLPHRAQSLVREPVWELAQSPASVHLAFRSDTPRLAVRGRTFSTETMPHMAAIGSRGLELFGGTPRRMKMWASVVADADSLSFERPLFENIAPQMREFRLYLPLYCALDTLEIGIETGAKLLAPSPPDVAKPVVFYGTSITQGGCASAPGHDFVSMVGRLMNIETINLGFSGNGKGEKEVARLISEIDASLFVLDYSANVDAAALRRTLPHFVDILRAARPEIPILLMSNVCFAPAVYLETMRREIETRRDIAMEFYVARRKRNDDNIHFADGFGLLPFGVEGAFVDGVHPTDHGFALMAQRLIPIIESIILRD